MRILNCLYYYRPHYSGLTVYTERLAKNLVARGHQVSIVTSRYDKELPRFTRDEGVSVHRIPVAFFVSKGPVMPAYGLAISRLAKEHDVLHLHVPQLAAAPAALLGKLLGKPVVLTYHCDLNLPPGFVNRVINFASESVNRAAIRLADVVVSNTRDYAKHSRILGSHMHKVKEIPPPIELSSPDPTKTEAFRRRVDIRPGQKLIGMAARLAAEKGAEFLAQALPMVLEKVPGTRVLYVGQYDKVIGEDAYAARLAPLLKDLGDHWSFLGILEDESMAAFFELCDVTVLPSINSTESFGMVQIESMMSGTPVVATDIPGVRCPVQVTGMGKIVPPRNARALAEAIVDTLEEPERYARDPEDIASVYGTDAVTTAYEDIFKSLVRDS